MFWRSLRDQANGADRSEIRGIVRLGGGRGDGLESANIVKSTIVIVTRFHELRVFNVNLCNEGGREVVTCGMLNNASSGERSNIPVEAIADGLPLRLLVLNVDKKGCLS